MATLTTTATRPSLFGGVVIIGGTIIGAGMFSPVVVRRVVFLVAGGVGFTWFCMLHSGLMILKPTHLPDWLQFRHHYQRPARQRLEPVNGVSIAFVLYILTYACISASGSILHHTFSEMSLNVPARGGLRLCTAGGLYRLDEHESGEPHDGYRTGR